MLIDIDSLREDLINYFGTASYYNPPAMIDLVDIESASDEEVIQIALQAGFDIKRYEVEENDKYR